MVFLEQTFSFFKTPVGFVTQFPFLAQGPLCFGEIHGSALLTFSL